MAFEEVCEDQLFCGFTHSACRVVAEVYITLTVILEEVFLLGVFQEIGGLPEVSLPHSGETAIRKDQESEVFVFTKEVENVLQCDVLVFANAPVPFITSTVSGVVNTEVLHTGNWIWRGIVSGVPDSF